MAAILATVRTRAVRRLLVVFGAFRAAEFGVWIATTAVAFERGGVRQATAVVIAQLVPATLVATFVGGWADRYTPRRVLVAGLSVQACGMLGAGIALASGAPIILVYAGAVLASAAISTTRPTIATLMPSAVREPAELAAANVAIGWLDGAATLGGPAITAITITTIGSAAPFILFGTVIAANALAARGAPELRESPRRATTPIETELEPPSVRVALGEVARAPGPRSVLLVLASRAYVDGALDLLYVVVAVQVLGGGGADAGWMNTAYGAGAVLGAAASTMLIRSEERRGG